MRIRQFITIAACLVSASALGQHVHDTVQLHVVDVMDSIYTSADSYTAYHFDSLDYLGRTDRQAADFLQSSSGIFVKNYGPGSSSSLTFRGGTAYHTRLYWEGLSIDNNMLGQSDASLFLAAPQAGLEFLKSGHSLAIGPGGFGGILHYRPGTDSWKGRRVDVSTELASFQRKTGHLNVFLGNGRVKFESYLSASAAGNNFSYVDYLDMDKVKQRENAAMDQVQWLPKLSFTLGRKQEVFLSSWFAEAHRQVPAPIGTASGEASQTDGWRKYLLGYRFKGKKMTVSLHSAWMDDVLNYNNVVQGIVSKNRVESWKNLLKFSHTLAKKWRNELQIKADAYEVKSNNYAKSIRELNLGFSESLFYTFDRGFLNASLRYDQWSRRGDAFMPSARLALRPFAKRRTVLFFVDASYNVRFPSFNELYWQDLGNPNLKPELARSGESGLRVSGQMNSWKYESEWSFFVSNISSMILWLPDENSLWRPVNVQRMLNTGSEFSAKATYSKKKTRIDASINYIYTRSSDHSEEGEKSNQQPYVPEHKLTYFLMLECNGLFIKFNQTLVSRLFTDRQNQQYIPMNAPAGLDAGKKFSWNRKSLVLSAGVENLFNENYQYVAHMPMPLRYYKASIRIILN